MPKKSRLTTICFLVRNWKEGKLKCFCCPSFEHFESKVNRGPLSFVLNSGRHRALVGEHGIGLSQAPVHTEAPLSRQWDGPRQPLIPAHSGAAAQTADVQTSFLPKHHDHLYFEERRETLSSLILSHSDTHQTTLTAFPSERNLIVSCYKREINSLWNI